MFPVDSAQFSTMLHLCLRCETGVTGLWLYAVSKISLYVASKHDDVKICDFFFNLESSFFSHICERCV